MISVANWILSLAVMVLFDTIRWLPSEMMFASIVGGSVPQLCVCYVAHVVISESIPVNYSVLFD